MGFNERASAAVGKGLRLAEDFRIAIRSPGDQASPGYSVQFDGVRSYYVGSQGEAGAIDVISFTRADGVVQVRLWPDPDSVFYVECEVSANPAGVLIWGARMGDDGEVNSQRAIAVTQEGRDLQYFVPPPFAGSSDGSARFWFTMQDGNQTGTWNLLRAISVGVFRRP